MTQTSMPFLGPIKPTSYAPRELVDCCKCELDAIRLCVQTSRLSNTAICDRLGISLGHFTRIMQGRAHWPTNKTCALMELSGCMAPLQWMAQRMGQELYADTKAQRRAELERELAALDAA